MRTQSQTLAFELDSDLTRLMHKADRMAQSHGDSAFEHITAAIEAARRLCRDRMHADDL